MSRSGAQDKDLNDEFNYDWYILIRVEDLGVDESSDSEEIKEIGNQVLALSNGITPRTQFPI